MGAPGRRALVAGAGAASGLALALVHAACGSNLFACGADGECTDGGVAGTCEDTGWCSFPDAECPSGARYGDHAGDSLAGECVPQEGTTGGDDDDSSPSDPDTLDVDGDSGDDVADVTTDDADTTLDPTAVDSTTEPPLPECGDGNLDPGEACDDDNRVDGDGCNTDCTLSGDVVWEIVEGAPGVPDGAASIDIDDADALWVGAWFTAGETPELAARKLALDGTSEWTTTITTPMPYDSVFAWGVAEDGTGGVAIAADGQTLDGAPEWVVARLSGDGEVQWATIEPGQAYGVDVGALVWAAGRTGAGAGRIIGYTLDGDEMYRHEADPELPDSWAWDVAVAPNEVVIAGVVDVAPQHGILARVMPSGVVLAAPELDDTWTQALALAQGEGEWWIVGRSGPQDGGWIARASLDLGMIDEPAVVTQAGLSANLHGVTVGPSGEVVAVGWQAGDDGLDDAIVLKYAADGELSWQRTYDADSGESDAARDVAIGSDGTIVVAGHAGGLGIGDLWVFALSP
jgi:cysteine-rich repeat protein